MTVCNLNPIDNSEIKTVELITDILNFNNISFEVNSTEQNGYSLVNEISSVLKANLIANNSISRDGLEEIGFTIDKMLISCYYNDIECKSEDFTYFHSFEYGNCYTFNSNKRHSRMTSKFGLSSGLSVELFVGIPGKNVSSSCLFVNNFEST